MNTFGLCSIHAGSFNSEYNTHYPKRTRDILVTLFRFHNGALLLTGYIPELRLLTGCIRGSTALVHGLLLEMFGQPTRSNSPFSGECYEEAKKMVLAQMVRALSDITWTLWQGGAPIPEKFWSKWHSVNLFNLSLDLVATPFNIFQNLKESAESRHPEVDYPLLAYPLWLA
ncbi:MAG: hypothetical protein AB7F31_02785 [Parachlamydiales bacterium]